MFLSTTLITLTESQMKYESGKKAGIEWDKRAYQGIYDQNTLGTL